MENVVGVCFVVAREGSTSVGFVWFPSGFVFAEYPVAPFITRVESMCSEFVVL